MSQESPADGYKRTYKNKGYVDQDGNVHRKFKDKAITPRWIVAVSLVVVGGAAISATLGATLSTIVGFFLGMALCGALLLRVVEMLIGERGLQAIGAWRDRRIDRGSGRDI